MSFLPSRDLRTLLSCVCAKLLWPRMSLIQAPILPDFSMMVKTIFSSWSPEMLAALLGAFSLHSISRTKEEQ